MKASRPRRPLVILAILLALSAGILAARVHAQVPDKFTNLKVLPKDISKDDLISAMRAFAGALGQDCEYCHVHKDNDPTKEMDWAADDLKAKTTARVMFQMTNMINATEIPKITTGHLDRVEVRCRTCHRGQARPFLIEDVLGGAYKAAGMDSLKTKYEELRKQYYGTDTYNFGERVLPQLGERIAGRAKPADWVQIAQYNLTWFPQSGIAYLMLGQAQVAAGDNDAAEEALKKAVALDPGLERNARWVRSQMRPE